MNTHYTRNLPHILPAEETFFITFRLHGSLPKEVMERLIEDRKAANGAFLTSEVNAGKRHFAQFDAFLDTFAEGNDWLKQPEIADLVKQAIHYHHERNYILHAYCIMSNHVHLLVMALPRQNSFFNVLKSLKGFTARQANVLLSRIGQPFWHPESYDHVVRSHDEFKRIILYILNNPVKAGLIQEWFDWPYSFVADE